MTACRTCPDPVNGSDPRWRYCQPCHDTGRQQRDQNLRNRYGAAFGLLAYEQLARQQGGICANPYCGDEPTDVDHDHACCPGTRTCGRCVRYLLCRACNLAEGHLKTTRRAQGLALLLERGA